MSGVRRSPEWLKGYLARRAESLGEEAPAELTVRARPAAPPPSEPEAEFALQLRALGKRIVWEPQHYWHPARDFRADFAVWREQIAGDGLGYPLLIEIDGAKYGAPGAHQTVEGIDRDCRRAAEAIELGYTVLRISTRMVKDGTALAFVERILGIKAEGR